MGVDRALFWVSGGGSKMFLVGGGEWDELRWMEASVGGCNV